jgi:hypothetical protein
MTANQSGGNRLDICKRIVDVTTQRCPWCLCGKIFRALLISLEGFFPWQRKYRHYWFGSGIRIWQLTTGNWQLLNPLQLILASYGK